MARKALIAVALIGAVIFYQRLTLCDCKKRITYKDIHLNDHLPPDTLFQPPSPGELEEVRTHWHSFDARSSERELLKTFNFTPNRRMEIWQHTAEGRKHYGAILLPRDFQEGQSYPLLVWANGLNQRSPAVNLDQSRTWKKVALELDQYFVIVPSFRGQALVVNAKRYCSDGFFGDAFTGAADDALRLLELSLDVFPEVDRSRLAVYGISRGGTVALLTARRNPNLRLAISQSGPTNFLLQSSWIRHGFQYKYQFLSHPKTVSEIRQHILRSSPHHFIDSTHHRLVVIQGVNDRIVPVVQARKLADKLRDEEHFTYIERQGGHGLMESGPVIRLLRQFAAGDSLVID